MLIITVKTRIEWINDLDKIPVIGDGFLFILMFVPAVLASFLLQLIIPGLDNDSGFSTAMFILLPCWNLFLWLKQIKLNLFFIPSWIFLGALAIIKVIQQF